MGTGFINEQQVTGTINTGVSNIFVPYTGKITGNFSSGQYTNVNLSSGPLYITGNFSKPMHLVGYGMATGGVTSGIFGGDLGYVYDPGLYTFYADYTGLYSGKALPITGFDPVDLGNNSGDISGLLVIHNIPVSYTHLPSPRDRTRSRMPSSA